jgi:hypothetical protein
MRSRAYFDPSKTHNLSRKGRRTGPAFPDGQPRMVAPHPHRDPLRERPPGARGTRSSRRAGAVTPRPISSSVGSAVGAAQTSHADLRLVMRKASRRASHFPTDCAPDGDTLTHTGNRGVNDPWGRACARRSAGTRLSRRAGVGHATSHSILSRKRGRGGTSESRGPATCHEKCAAQGLAFPDRHSRMVTPSLTPGTVA